MNVENHISTSIWPTSGQNNARTGRAHADMSFPLEIAWTFSECSPIMGGIIASESTIFFPDNKGTLYAIDINKGTLKWYYSLGGPAYGTPVITQNKLYIGNSYTAFCLNPKNGKEIWKSTAHKQAHLEKSANSPLCIMDYVIFCDEYFTVYNANTGKVITTKNISYEPHANTGPCADSENIYIPVHRKIEVISLNTLQPVGTINVKSKIASGPVVYKNYIAVGLNDSSVEVVSIKNKLKSWNYIFSKREYRLVLSRPACAYDMLFAADPFGMIYGFKMITGQLVWEHHYFERIDSPLVISNNKLFITGNEYIFALSLSEGEFMWERAFHTRKTTFPVTSSPALANGYLFVGRDKLYAFTDTSTKK